MITLIVECTIRNNDACWVTVTLRFVIFLLLRPYHNQRKLTRRLPYFIFFYNFLCISRHIFISLIISWLWALHIIDFVSGVMSVRIYRRTLLLFFLMNYPSTSHNIKSSLSFSDDLSVLMLFQTDVFIFEIFLCRFITFVDWFWVNIVIEAFGSE
jgi:hypothetical protein